MNTSDYKTVRRVAVRIKYKGLMGTPTEHYSEGRWMRSRSGKVLGSSIT
jgi:hypothetical protein